MPLVSAKDITVKIAGKKILTDAYLTVRRGEIVTLIGPNGAGKSTLVKVVLGLITPQQGEVRLQKNIRMGYMPQKVGIDPFMPLSVARFLKVAQHIEPQQWEMAMQELGIQRLLNAPMQTLSGGELQRVLLARALLSKPDLLVLDEPVQGVDVTGQEELYHLIMQIRDTQNCGILMVSHDLYLVMAGTDSVVCLNQHVCCSGHPSLVSQHPEFLNLFGNKDLNKLAIYAHRHNHKHGLEGDVCH